MQQLQDSTKSKSNNSKFISLSLLYGLVSMGLLLSSCTSSFTTPLSTENPTTTTDSTSGAASTTLPPTPTTTPTTSSSSGPIISAVSTSHVTQNEASISWSLSEASTGQVEYGTTSSYGQMSMKESSFQFTSHTQKISSLTSGTLYHYRVHSTNQAGKESISGDYTFTTVMTAPAPATTPPLSTGVYHAPPPTSSLVVSVKDKGATGNGVTNDTATIQAAINQVAGTGGTVLVPAGTYLVSESSIYPYAVLNLKSNMTFKMEPGAILYMKSTTRGTYSILYLNNVTNVNVIGGKISGERHRHIPTTYDYISNDDQWGYGVNINERSSNIYIDGVESDSNWGDGFNIGGDTSGINTNINFFNVIADDNRRQGMSICEVNGMVVRDSVFKNTRGQWPMAGIDIEPLNQTSYGHETVSNLLITTSIFDHNYGGIELWGIPGAM